MAEVNLVALIFGVVLGCAPIHLGGAGGLEHAVCIECKRALELARLCCFAQILLHTGLRIKRIAGVFVDVETVQASDCSIIAVDVVLFTEGLLNLQKVVDMV